MATRVRARFAGIEFSGFAHGETHISVPMPAFMKILNSDRIEARLRYDIEMDGNGQYDRYNQDADLGYIRNYFESERRQKERPWLLYLDPEKRILHYCPHSNKSYEFTETVIPAGSTFNIR